jgi:hypothetical protein
VDATRLFAVARLGGRHAEQQHGGQGGHGARGGAPGLR